MEELYPFGCGDSDIVAFVSDDPYERFEIRSNNTGASATSDIFNNANIVYTAGDSANYVSRVRLNDSTLTTSTEQLQILGSTKDTGDNNLTTITRCVCCEN
jgi:hypothetical protein